VLAVVLRQAVIGNRRGVDARGAPGDGRGGERRRIEAALENDERGGLVSGRGSRQRKDRGGDVALRIEAGVVQELRGLAVGRDGVGLVEDAGRRGGRFQAVDANLADRERVAGNERERIGGRRRRGEQGKSEGGGRRESEGGNDRAFHQKS